MFRPLRYSSLSLFLSYVCLSLSLALDYAKLIALQSDCLRAEDEKIRHLSFNRKPFIYLPFILSIMNQQDQFKYYLWHHWILFFFYFFFSIFHHKKLEIVSRKFPFSPNLYSFHVKSCRFGCAFLIYSPLPTFVLRDLFDHPFFDIPFHLTIYRSLMLMDSRYCVPSNIIWRSLVILLNRFSSHIKNLLHYSNPYNYLSLYFPPNFSSLFYASIGIYPLKSETWENPVRSGLRHSMSFFQNRSVCSAKICHKLFWLKKKLNKTF